MTSPTNLTASALGAYIELYDLDATGIGGSFYRFTAHTYATTAVTWQGNVYTPIPIESSDWEYIGPGAASPKPKMRIGNAAKVLLPAIISLGDLVGARLTRWRTFVPYLDGQPDADPTCYFAPMTYYVEQKTAHDNVQVEWQLANMLDREGIKLPREQVLRDVNFPGVGLYRQR